MTIFDAGLKVGLVIAAGAVVTVLLLIVFFDFAPREGDWKAAALLFLLVWLAADGLYRLIRRLRRKAPPPAG